MFIGLFAIASDLTAVLDGHSVDILIIIPTHLLSVLYLHRYDVEAQPAGEGVREVQPGPVQVFICISY